MCNTVAQPDPDKKRPLPWLIDVFLYPISVPALIILGIYTLTPVVIGLLRLVLGVVLGSFAFSMLLLVLMFGLLFIIIDLIVTAYVFWYFGECIRASALGKIRAPETLSNFSDNTTETVCELLRIASCVFICLGPGLTCLSITRRADWICWSLLSCGFFLLPMALLATVMFGSLSALNPVLIITSIFNTSWRYCLVLLTFGVPAAIVAGVSICLPQDSIGVVGNLLHGVGTIIASFTGLPLAMPKYNAGIVSLILRAAYTYLALVAAHILGRFYYRNEERLYWEV